MKKYIKTLFIIILSYFIFSCDKSKKLEEEIAINFNASPTNKEKIKYSEFVDSISYVVIKSKEILGNVRDLKFVQNKFYLYDKATYSIIIFDKLGNEINKISRQGRGPGEYTTISQFDVNPTTGTISILEIGNRRVSEYSIEGELLNRFKIETIARYFSVMHNGDYLFFTPDYMKGSLRGLWKVGREGNFIDHLVKIDDDHKFEILNSNFFSRINDTTIGLMGIEDKDEIYHITDTKITTKYKLKFDIKFPEEIKNKESTKVNFERYSGKAYTKSIYLEYENLVVLGVSNFKTNKLVLFNKQTKSVRNLLGMENDIDGVLGFFNTADFNNIIVNTIPLSFSEKVPLKIRVPHEKLLKKLNIKNDNNIIIYQLLHLKK